MSKNRSSRQRGTAAKDERRIVVRGVPRAEPDLRQLARALIELARKEIEREQERAASGGDADQKSGSPQDTPAIGEAA